MAKFDKYAKFELTCLTCNDVFKVRNYKIKTAKFCSMACRAKFFCSGDKNYLWKGGRYSSRGYIMVKHPDTGKYVREHRLIVEQNIGRVLTEDEHVHHINGKRDDNRIDNLEIMTREEHGRLHGKVGGKWSKNHG